MALIHEIPILSLAGFDYSVLLNGLSVFLLEAIMFKASPRGQGLVEYAFIIILVAILVIVMLALFGSGVGNMFSTVVSGI